MHRGLWLFLASALLAAPAAGQTVRGRVIDGQSGERIPFASLTLLRGDGSVARRVLADSMGRFAISAAAGAYRLRADRIGYTSTTSEGVLLHPLELVQVEVRLQLRGVPLEPLVVTARNRLERGRDGYARRQALGKGYFLTPDSIAARNLDEWTDAFHAIPKIWVTRAGIRSMAGWGCFSILVDRHPRPFAFSQSKFNNVPMQPGSRPMGGYSIAQRLAAVSTGIPPGGRVGEPALGPVLDSDPLLDEILDPRNIRAVEVYQAAEDIPKELVNAFNWDALWPTGSLGRCGIAIIWSNLAW